MALCLCLSVRGGVPPPKHIDGGRPPWTHILKGPKMYLYFQLVDGVIYNRHLTNIDFFLENLDLPP